MNEIKDIIKNIKQKNTDVMEAARKRQDYLAKVPGSLGRLEEISIKLAGITEKPCGNEVDRQAIVLMCADNGVVKEGVASAPQSVTLMQTINFTKRITGVGSQAEHFGIDVLAVDIGVKLPIMPEFLSEKMVVEEQSGSALRLERKVVNRRIADGTRNFSEEPAMTRDEAIRGIMIGLEAVEACKKCGINLIGVGEMGIGNTTTSSAIISLLKAEKEKTELKEIIERVVGRGGGLSDDGLEKKKKIINDALIKYEPLYKADGELDAIELLRCVGGFDIAGMVGVYLGAALYRIPAVIDGVISIAAALLAVKLCPDVKDYLFTSHKSKEGGYAVASELLGIEPMYDLGMRLGEGSGCPIAFKIIEAACAVMNNMKTLEEAQVDAGYLDEFRKDGQFQ